MAAGIGERDGVLLGQEFDKYYLVRTFITYDMTMGMQQNMSTIMKKAKRNMMSMYGCLCVMQPHLPGIYQRNFSV